MSPSGSYNPHAPYILGEEWVPIRDEDTIFSPAVNAVEVGHGFTLATTRSPTNARFYINELRTLSDRGQTFMAAVYAAGTEDQSGPIERVVIPCNAVTGTSATASGAATLVECLQTQSASSGVVLDCSQPNTGIAMSFAVSSYPVLTGKRILGVNLLSGVSASSDITGPTRNVNTSQINVGTVTTINSVADPQAIFGRLRKQLELDVTPFGEINQFWTANSPNLIADRLPWTGAQLTRLDAVATRLYTKIETGTNRGSTANSSCYVYYAALEVIFCEEKRLVVGATQYGTTNSSHSFGAESILGANQIVMHDVNGGLTPALTAGAYVMTISSADVGGLNDNQAQTTSDYPDLNAVRELYQISPHPGVQVDIPFPPRERVGDVFTAESTHILPQISLHSSTGTLTEPHVYGRQVDAQVYGTNTATQSIFDDIAPTSASYQQVRYYARRYGDTTIPLTLTGATPNGMSLPGIAGSYASTPDNAALDVVGDIDLRADGTFENWQDTVSGIRAVSKWVEPAQHSYTLSVASGLIRMIWSSTGANTLVTQSTAVVPVTSGRYAIRAFLDVDNGAAGNTVTFYTAPTIAGPWVQLGAPVITAGVTSIFNSTSPGEVGTYDNGTTNPTRGLFHSVKIINSAAVEVANPDFSAQAPGTTVFVDAAGRTWTLNGTAAIVAGNTGSSAALTVAQFDALQEILDGWKEVTLRFGTAPSMGGGTQFYPAWTWSAAAETAGNRWEVLGACAPAVSGAAGNLFNLVPSPNQLSAATYQPNAGTGVSLTWMPQGVGSPYVASPTQDVTSDAALIFSQDPPTVSGVGLTALTQTVTGIGLDCGSLPCCIPSGISYQRVTWGAAANVVTGMVLPGVAGSYASTPDAASLDIVGDIDLRADVTLATWIPAAQSAFVSKWVGAGNQLSYFLALTTTGTLGMVWSTAGTGGTVTFVNSTVNPSPGPDGRLAVRATLDVNNGAGGSTTTFYTAPTMAGPWTVLGAPVVAAITSIFAGTAPLEVGSTDAGAFTNLTGVVHSVKVINGLTGTPEVANPNFDNQAAGTTSFADTATPAKTWTLNGTAAIVAVSPPWFGAYELQRFDAYSPTGDFQTIMLATSRAVTGFNDFEARVGITSVYRIRSLNALNFAGQWSTYVSGSPPTPGVTGGCANATGALIFTSNADQSGLSNAAYTMQWEGTPTEDFGLPEGDSVAYQPMYGRDGSVAFHGTERELETFSRTVLLNAAAISPIRLADAATLRNLAWADLPYVCVRDDIGDRWFASVRVPGINVRANRTKYMARVEIVETTQTPAPVDP